MGTKIIKTFKVIFLILLAIAFLYYGSLLAVLIVIDGDIKWQFVRDVLIPAVGVYLLAKDLFVVKWKEKRVLENGENQS